MGRSLLSERRKKDVHRGSNAQGLWSGRVVFSRNSKKTSVTGAGRAGDKAREVDGCQNMEGLGSRPGGQPICSNMAALSLRQ